MGIYQKQFGWPKDVLAKNNYKEKRAAIKLTSFEVTKIDAKTGIPSKNLESDLFIIFENLNEVEQFVKVIKDMTDYIDGDPVALRRYGFHGSSKVAYGHQDLIEDFDDGGRNFQ